MVENSVKLKVIKAAKEILKDRDHWTKDSFARTSDGNTIGFSSSHACKFCAEGALKRACFNLDVSSFDCSRIIHYVDAVANNMYDTYMVNINDDNDDAGFDMIHNVFDKAIERLAA